MSIIAYPLEATEYTAEDVQSYLSTRTSGVYSEEITLTPEGMTATISPFLAWFNYAKFKGCSVAVTAPEVLTFAPASVALDRIDRVVLRLDFSVNKAYFTIIQGEASSTPTPPEITKTEAVNDISPFYVRIRSGATEITASDITSTILDESVCGIMRDGVTGIPTAQLQSQAEALILRLHDAISEVQTGSAFMIGEVYDPDEKGKPIAFEDETYAIDGSKPTTGDKALFCDGNTSLFGGETLTKLIANIVGTSNYRALNIHKTNTVDKAFYFQSVDETSNKLFQIFGTHNKPNGTFTGNGNKTRTVSIGGSANMLVLFVNEATFSDVLFVTANGFASTISAYGTNITFTNGVLTLKNTQDEWNVSGFVYNYISL